MIDWRRTVVSQHANSPALLSLLESMDEWLDPTKDINAWYDYVWDVDTAQGFGLDIWGRIVGIRRVVTVPALPSFLGFKEATDAQPFGQAPFYTGIVATENFEFTDEVFRTMILVKAAANIALVTSPALNAMLRTLFPLAMRGRSYVSDLGGMAMRFVFEFPLRPPEVAMLSTLELLPRPTGVQASLYQPAVSAFGFKEAGDAQPFGQGIFNYPATNVLMDIP